MTEDEMVGWHHRLHGHEFEQTLGDGEGQGSLVCCSPWGHKALDTTEQLNNNTLFTRDLQALSVDTTAIHCLLQIQRHLQTESEEMEKVIS